MERLLDAYQMQVEHVGLGQRAPGGVVRAGAKCRAVRLAPDGAPMILSPTESADFFRLMAALDTYTNLRLAVVPGLGDVESMRAAPPGKLHEIRTAGATTPALLDDFVRENPFALPENVIADARLFRHAVRGRFFVERVLKQHAIFIAMTDPATVYGVQGLTEPIDAVLSRAQPFGVAVMLDATLLPWRGRIVWDGVISLLPIMSGPGIRRAFKADYTRAKDRGEIVVALGSAAVMKPKRAAPDWRPTLAQIVAAAEGLGKTDTTLQAATFTLLKHAARLAQAAVVDDNEGVLDATRKAERALRKVITSLEG
jgi:hypothetical protein